MKNIIHIYGSSGSGTSTLGRKISEELEYKFMDTDDYDDVEEKWVVAPEGKNFTKEEICEQIHFQEQYFDSEIVT